MELKVFRDSLNFLWLYFGTTLCFLLFQMLFSFFLMAFSVRTVHFSEFILFDGKEIIFSLLL